MWLTHTEFFLIYENITTPEKNNNNLLTSFNSQLWQIVFCKNGYSNFFHLLQGELARASTISEVSIPSPWLWAHLSHSWDSGMWGLRCHLTLKGNQEGLLTSAWSSYSVYSSEALSQVVPLRNQPHEGPLEVSSQHSQLHPDLPVSPDEAPDITDQKRHSHCALSDSLTHQTSECKNAVVVLYHYVAGGLFHIGKHWKHWFMFSFPSPFQKFAL